MTHGIPVSLIVGLGNPGMRYAKSRHNAGFWFLQRLQQTQGFMLAADNRHQAEIGTFMHDGRAIRVIAPQTFMNLSGSSVAPFAAYYRIPTQAILVIHDDLDLPPGKIKLKQSGGNGGHNGLKDISLRLGSNAYGRLRIGIGRPPPGDDVSAYVLRKIPADDEHLIQIAFDHTIDTLPLILDGDTGGAMNKLHVSTG